MRKALAIALTQFRIVMKSKMYLATMFGMPLAFIIIFGLLIGGGASSDTPSTPQGRVYPLAIIDEDRSLASALLIESLKNEPNLAVTTTERADLDKLIADMKVFAGFAIPPGFGEALSAGQGTELSLITYRGSNMEWGIQPVLRRNLMGLASDFRLALQMAGSDEEAQVRAAMARIAAERANRGASLAVESAGRPAAKAEGSSYNALNHSALGYTVMSVMMAILMMSGTILYERQHGTWGRLLTTPTDRYSLLAGYLLSFFLTGLFQFAVLVFGTRLIFQVQWGPLLPLFAVGAATVLASAGIGLFLAGIVRSYEQQQTLGIIFVIATSMLGGLFWPLELMSPTMQRIGYLTPQAWAMTGLTEVALRGGAWASLAWPLTVLLALAVLFAGAGLLRVRYE